MDRDLLIRELRMAMGFERVGAIKVGDRHLGAICDDAATALIELQHEARAVAAIQALLFDDRGVLRPEIAALPGKVREMLVHEPVGHVVADWMRATLLRATIAEASAARRERYER